MERLGFSTDHFAEHDGFRGRPRAGRPLCEVMVEGSTYSRGKLKDRLYAEGLKQRACEICGQGELWHGRRMSLILDHVNGVGNDHRFENLRIVCPNCAATLDTHCGRRFRLQPKPCELCGTTFQPRRVRQRFCSRRCGTTAPRPYRRVPRARKVERPSYEQLLEEVRADGFSATGRRYGVSDNAIRKWICWYEREAAAAQEDQTGLASAA